MVHVYDTHLPLSDPTWTGPLCLQEEFWHKVLSCFTDLFSVHVDRCYGGYHLNWVFRTYWVDIIDTTTWISAVYRTLHGKTSIGLMFHLLEHDIACEDYQSCVQYAVDNNRLDTLHFLLHKDHIKTLNNGALVCPTIDDALHKGYENIIDYLLWRLPNTMWRSILEKPTSALNELITHNKWTLIRKIVPRCVKVSYTLELKTCIEYSTLDNLRFLVSHMETDRDLLTNELPEEAVIQNKIGIMNYLLSRMNIIVEPKMFSLAFSHGHESLVDIMMKRYKHSIPNREAIRTAIKAGYFNMIKKIDANFISPEALDWSLYIDDPSTFIQMLSYLYTKLKRKITIHHGHIDRCIDRGNSIGVLLLYNLEPSLEELSDDQKLRMIKHGMASGIKALHVTGQTFHNVQGCFLTACRIANLDILKVLLEEESYRPQYSELEEGLRLITLQAKSIEKSQCWIYVNNYFQKRKSQLSKRNFLDISDPPLEQQSTILKRPKHVTNTY